MTERPAFVPLRGTTAWQAECPNDMELLKEKLSRDRLQTMAGRMFGSLVKAVVDIERELIVVDAELHADQEAYLLEKGSRQENIWGINLYPAYNSDDDRFVEFDSMINLRPWQNNTGRGVDDPTIRETILRIVRTWIA